MLFDLFKGQENTNRSKQPIQWEKIHQETLDELLTHPNFDSLFLLCIDTSSSGIGCALYQIQDEKLRVI